jgi:UMF1 family MFS transporter
MHSFITSAGIIQLTRFTTGVHRKRLLLAFAFTGAAATAAFIAVMPQWYLLASALVIVGVVCLGSTFVLLNSFLPLLSANHPDVRHQEQQQDDASSAQLKLSVQISSKGVGLGYAAAVCVQILSILLLVLLKKANFGSDSTPLRCVLFVVGVSWAALTIPGALWLRDRPGPSLKPNSMQATRLPTILRYTVFAWTSVWKTVKTAARLRQTGIFLIAWFCLSDAVATVSGTAILFARTELHMGTIAIALLSITATASGIAGAFAWPKISKRYGFQTKSAIIACVLLMEIIPFYGLLGFLPFVQSWGVGGLQQAWEIYPLGFVHGFVMGGLSSYCRAFYGEIIPPGSEAAFYALYAITDKGSSAVGPAIVGAIIDSVGTIRPAFGFLAVLIALPVPLLYLVDVEKGRADAVALSMEKGGEYSYQDVALDDYEGGDDGGHAPSQGLMRGWEDEELDDRRTR